MPFFLVIKTQQTLKVGSFKLNEFLNIYCHHWIFVFFPYNTPNWVLRMWIYWKIPTWESGIFSCEQVVSLLVEYATFEFTTYMPNLLLTSSYHSIIPLPRSFRTNILFWRNLLNSIRNGHHVLAYYRDYYRACACIAHNGTVALTRGRKHTTSREESKLFILQCYISESICMLKRFLFRGIQTNWI